MMPITAMAVGIEEYKVWVGGIKVTSHNKDNITGEGITGTVSYDPDTNTLTLDNASISKAYEGWGGDTFCIYNDSSTPLILKLIGDNFIAGVDSIRSTYGIRCGSMLTIEGEGSLTVTPGRAYITDEFGNNHSSGILTQGGLIINDCIIDVHGERYGLYEYDNGKNVIINGGEVTAYGRDGAIQEKLKTNGEKVSVMAGDVSPGDVWDCSELITTYKYVKIDLAPYFITNISITNATSVQSNTDLALTGTVDSNSITSHAIIWSVENSNGTGATINDGIFKATSPGTVKVKASVVNGISESDYYTETFDITVTAEPVVTHTITATATTGGSISPSGSVTVNNGTSQDFIITPDSNYYIADVTVDGVSQGAISTYTFNGITGNHSITAAFNYNGGSGSGSGNSTRNLNNDNTIIIIRPTADQPDRPTQGEIKVPGTMYSNGNITISITDKNVIDVIDKALADAEKNGNEQNGITVVFRVDTGSKTGSNVTVNLPKTVQDIIIAKNIVNTIVVVDKPDIRIDMDLDTIKEINNLAKSDVNITAKATNSDKLTDDAKKAIGNRPLFDLKVNYGRGKQVKDFGTGSVLVTIPYTLEANEKAENVFAVYVDDDGAVHWLADSVYDNVNKVLRFSTNHFSTYGVGYKVDEIKFTDIANHWAKEDIEFVVGNGLFSGTSEATFSPDTDMTRGMFVTVLGRLANADIDSFNESSFNDVKRETYYMRYIEWASKCNIVIGIGNGNFEPDKAITREQMAVIMSNYAKTMEINLTQLHGENVFEDSDNISDYAKDAVKQMQMAGNLSGKNGNLFDPLGTTTRAEVSAVLHRFMK